MMWSFRNIPGCSLLALISLACVLSLAGQPQVLRFHELTDKDGLPNNQFRKSIQDRSGYIWMASSNGLVRYDGYSFKEYRYSNTDTTGLRGNYISDLFEDSRGRLWAVIFGKGVNISDNTKSTFSQLVFTGADSIDALSMFVSDIAEDSLGRFWLVTNSGMLILREHEGLFQVLDPAVLMPELKECGPLNPNCVYSDHAGRVWIGSTSGVFIFNTKTGHLLTPSRITGLSDRLTNMIAQDRLGRIWVACQGDSVRLYYTEADQIEFKAFKGIPFRSPVRGLSFVFDLDNRIWVAEFGAQFYAYDFRDSLLFLESSVNSSVPYERFVRNPFVDHSGNVWIHAEGFLIYPYPKGFQNYLHEKTFHQSISAMYGVNDDLLLAYREQGFIQLNLKSGQTKHFSSTEEINRIPGDHIQAMYRMRNGNLILIGYNHIAFLDPAYRVIAQHHLPGTNRAALEDSQGRLWIGGFGGLYRFSIKEGILDTYKFPRHIGDPRQFVQSILEDRYGNIWFAGDVNGLGRLDPKTDEIIQFLPVRGDSTSLPSSSIDEIQMDGRGMIWAATDAGLVRLDPTSFEITTFDKSDGFRNDYISAIVCTDDLIWVSTYAGISSFNPATEEIINYDADDGLVNRSYCSRCAWWSEGGTIYFGGANGVDYFNPDILRRNPAAPVIALEHVTVDNSKVILPAVLAANDGLHLTYQNDFIEIAFSGLYYAAPQSVQYLYKMDGLGDDWVNLESRRTAVFTDLKPGEYVFRVKAVSPDGIWSENELTLPVKIRPPFYETVWFRMLVAFLLGAGIYVIMKVQENRLRKRQQEEADIARKITELEKRALQAQMNPHFIYNCMNSIQQFMVVHDFEGAMKYLTRFSRILRTVLNMSALNRISLADELKLIEDYLELENMRFPNKFTYDIEVSPALNVHIVEIPPFFIQPQVENAIRHGLLQKTGQGHLKVMIFSEGQYLKVVVEDNGIGRAAAVKAKAGQMEKHPEIREIFHRESKGLAIVEERLSHLHQSNGVLPFKITDLYDTANNPAGTRVEVYLPME